MQQISVDAICRIHAKQRRSSVTVKFDRRSIRDVCRIEPLSINVSHATPFDLGCVTSTCFLVK